MIRRMGCAVIVLAWAVGLAQARSPNVIIFLTDDQGRGDLGCYGATDIRTPHIDALAESGVKFTNYYAPSPLCAPSRAAMLTGRYPRRAGMSQYRNISSDAHSPGLNTEETTLGDLVKPLGYATAIFGKWHLGTAWEFQPNSQGFDEFFGHLSSAIDSFSHMYYASTPFFHDLWRNREEVFEDGIHMTDLITRETVRFIRENRDQPFLIYVAYNAPHYPMVAHARYLEMYRDVPRLRRFHIAMLAGVDDSVGEIMQTLRDEGVYEDTFVFFSSDNGAANRSDREEGGGSNYPGREYKRSLFSGGIKVPGIVSWPRQIPAGEVRDQLACGIDVFTTVADITGAPLPRYRIIDGISWIPFLKDASKPGHEAMFFEWAGQRSVRWGKWRLVVNPVIDQYIHRHNYARPDGDRYIFLVDVEADPYERTNLARENPEVVKQMLAMFDDWRLEIGQDVTASPMFLVEDFPEQGTEIPPAAMRAAGLR